MTTRTLIRLLLWTFFVLVFAVHYKTKFFEGTLHSWVLFLGCLITIPQIVRKCGQSNYNLPFDYTLVALMAVLLLLGFVIEFQDATLITLQAYMLSFATYVFVRASMPRIPIRYFYALNTLFLIGNSVLMMAQFVTGNFFPARYLAAGDPLFLVPSGFADGPTKNGMIHAAALSLVFAKIVLFRVSMVSVDVLALLLGALSLILTVSRAGVVAFVIAACMTIILAAIQKKKHVQMRTKPFWAVLIVSVVTIVGLYFGITYVRSETVDSTIGEWTADIVWYKFIPKESEIRDDSLATRLATLKTAWSYVLENPGQALIGSGLGAFEGIFARVGPRVNPNDIDFVGLSSHNSYVEFFVEGGAIVFCLWLCLVVHVVRKVLGRPDAVTVMPVLIGLISTMGFMLFHDVLRGRTFWMPLGILASFAYTHVHAEISGIAMHPGNLARRFKILDAAERPFARETHLTRYGR